MNEPTYTTRMRFASSEARLPIPPDLIDRLVDAADAPQVDEWLDDAAQRIDTLPHGILFCVGRLRLPEAESRDLAHAICRGLLKALERRGAPGGMTVNFDEAAPTLVVPGNRTRCLAPHHDGNHTSYLSPSLLDVPEWNPQYRRFSEVGVRNTQSHRLYQGLFIQDPGEALSLTTFYDLVPLLGRAYAHQHSRPPGDVVELAAWLGDNISSSLARRSRHGGRYAGLPVMLGASDLAYHGVSLFRLESDFTPQELERFPQLERFRNGPENRLGGSSPAEGLLNQVLLETVGLSYSELRRHFESAVPSERFDLVIWHNLSLLHGAWEGGASRVLEPVCLTIDEPVGHDYEAWLAKVWRRPPPSRE